MMAVSQQDELVRFATCVINRKTRQVAIGGKPAVLHAKALSLLLYLIDNRDREVCRTELLAAVWPGVIVSDNNVSVQLSKVRQMLRLVPDSDCLVLTLDAPAEPSYRFVGDIDPPLSTISINVAETVIPAAASRLKLRGIGGRRAALWSFCGVVLLGASVFAWQNWQGAPAPPMLSFVVLPFRNLSGDRAQDYLADRVTDDLVAALNRVPRLVVISRQSAESVQTRTPQEIGRTLRVRYLVRGSVTPEDTAFHVYTELVDTGSGATLRGWSFDAARDQIAGVRTQIVGYITRELNLALDRLADARSGDPKNPDAVDLFYRARSRLDHGGALADYSAAQAMLEQAIALEPGFVEAKAELGWVLLSKVTNLDDPDDLKDYALARSSISDALRNDRDNTTALAAYTRELMLDGKCGEAVPIATRLITFEPGDLRVHAVLAGCAQIDMRFDDAVREYGDMLRLDPDSPASRSRHLAIGTILLVQGNAKRATPHLTQCIDELSPSNDLGAGEQCLLMLIAARDLDGEQDAARASYRVYAQRVMGRTTWRLAGYYASKWLDLDGFHHLMAALNDAGMPEYAPEAGDVSPDGACGPGDFAPTPRALPAGGVVLTTDAFIGYARSSRPLVIDLGRHRIDLPRAVYFANAAHDGESELQFVRRILQERLSGAPAPWLVLAGDGVTGCSAYNVAVQLISTGSTNVAWYRSGEEGWAAHMRGNVASIAPERK